MITSERKSELLSSMEYTIERFLDKQGIFHEAIRDVATTSEEEEFLQQCWYRFSVEEV